RSDRDWSSDVCSSDLKRSTSHVRRGPLVFTKLCFQTTRNLKPAAAETRTLCRLDEFMQNLRTLRTRILAVALFASLPLAAPTREIGRASCRERAWTWV